ncbi:MAG: aminoglycoside phosphotransferase family protein [Acidimicrobiia bacterium]|nr:MAG: aminoglycoside phosphotransferase family protein [Acidimicrobiia bacterium]
MRLPSNVAGAVADWKGDGGKLWFDALPNTIAAAERRWGINIGTPYEPGGYTSYVAPAVTEKGAEVVYKCTIPHDEAIGEADALVAYHGDGAVHLSESNPDAYELLMERCIPGADLWSVDEDAGRIEVATGLMGRLWRDVTSENISMLTSVSPRWADVTERRLITCRPPWVLGPIERGIDLLRTLPFDAEYSVLLHGDLHPGNILAAKREPWLVIDPKPMAGDPAFEPIQLLVQAGGRTTEPPSPADLEQSLADLATRLNLDAERIGLWAIARCSEWSMWSLDHNAVAEAALEHSWARTLDEIIPL